MVQTAYIIQSCHRFSATKFISSNTSRKQIDSVSIELFCCCCWFGSLSHPPLSLPLSFTLPLSLPSCNLYIHFPKSPCPCTKLIYIIMEMRPFIFIPYLSYKFFLFPYFLGSRVNLQATPAPRYVCTRKLCCAV